ncbi:MAG: hypothetical protein EOT04_02555 [Candidatus Chaera renei]|uniref:Uncharacterized protein n=1 Tax=Candidatus Chaera renei TaxID=2506947 RepID=A0A4V1J7K1_9BACT|nr:MAG: hypothetical protein EOT04_02555 [Candidatus Chaera renei]
MKELDFDELDKAVSAVLEPAAAPSQPAKPDTANPAPEAVEPDRSAAAAPKNDAASLVPSRRGQFMDVVRPAAAKPQSGIAATPVSTSGKTVQPLSPETPSAKPELEPPESPAEVSAKTDTVSSARFETPAVSGPGPDTQTAAPERPALDAPGDDAVSSEPQWPDPLEVHGFNDGRPESEPGSSNPEDINQTSDRPESAAADATGPARESLFLKDAKVEKRPLGAFATAEGAGNPPAGEEAALTTETVNSPDGPAAADDYSAKDELPALLPPELDKDILAIESELKVFDPETRADAGGATPRHSGHPAGPVSIQPQYQEKPAEASGEARPLFDVADYHPALPVVPHGHGTKHVAVWVSVALLLLAATAAAFAYWFYKGL